MGFTFTVTQVIVIRELLVIFLGNELSIGIILANWLLLEAAGSYFLGKRARGAGLERKYAFLQLLLSLLLPVTIYTIRSLRDIMGLSIGEGASLLQILFWTALILMPLGVVDGLLFALGCGLYSDALDRSPLAIGKVYLLEALGAGAGGVLYTFVLIPWCSSFEAALLLATANLISGLLLLAYSREKRIKRRGLAGLLAAFLAVNAVLLIFSGARGLEEISLQRQWRGLDILDSRWSPYGNVAVGRREDQLTFFSNGIAICTTPVPDIAFAEEMVHYPLLSLSSPESVLIIGGGFGGVISEALKHPINEVHYAEIDPLMIQLIKEHLTPLTRRELENPRMTLHMMDGGLYVKTAMRKFDAVLLNLPPPSTLELNRFYTAEFFGEISRVLKKTGLVALHLPGSEAYLSRERRDLNLCIRRSLQQVFPSVFIIPGEVNFILAFASAGSGFPSPEELIRRLEERKIPTRFFRESQIRLRLEGQRLQWLEDSLSRGGAVELNRNAHPRGVYYGIAYWNAQFHPNLQVLWGKIGDLRLWHAAVFILMLAGAASFLRGKNGGGRQEGTLVWIVSTTTGFFGMASSILFIFAFQTLYGYAYHWIGLLIAAFMAGIASGSWTMTRWLGKIERVGAAIIGLEIAVIFFTTLGMGLLAFLYAHASWENSFVTMMRWGFLLLGIVAGYLVGLQFPLANCLFFDRREGVIRTAGILYGADLFGAFMGSLLVGVIIVPALGILQTCAVIILLKMASLGLFWLSGSAAITRDLIIREEIPLRGHLLERESK